MEKLKLFFALFCILILALPASAQEEEEKWRNFEVSLVSGLSMPTGDLKEWKDTLGAKTDIHFNLQGGYFFSEKLAVGMYFNFTDYDIDDDYGVGFKMYDAGLYTKYAFSNESYFEPFLKISGGMLWPKYPTWVTPTQKSLRELSYDPGFTFAAYFGLLYYTSEFGGIFLEVGYHNDFLDGSEATYHDESYTIDINASYLEINAGINVFFGPEE